MRRAEPGPGQEPDPATATVDQVGQREQVDQDPAGLVLDQRLVRASGAAGEELPGDHLVVDLSSGRYFSLGEVGGFVWRRLDGSRTLEQIVSEVVECFDVGAERARADLLDLGRQLVEHRLAEPVGDEPASSAQA